METGAWLTAARVARLPRVLRAIHSHPPTGVPSERIEKVGWRACGGPLNEVSGLILALRQADLISVGSTVRLTKAGRTVTTQDHQHGGTLLARALIRAGVFASQLRRLTELSSVDSESRDLICLRQLAVENSPQLVGLLRRFPGVSFEDRLRVPASLRKELAEIWALLPATSSPEYDPRKDIGNRGELYSYYFEQVQAEDSSTVRWVAQDDEGLGYDIENISSTPHRRIEVKASSSSEIRFFLSANEWNTAHHYAEYYEVHFWGGINLNRDVKEEYTQLRATGYPIIYQNIAEKLIVDVLDAVPTQYLVTPNPL